VLRARLLARGRQDGSDVEQRLRRASRFVVGGERVHRVDNGGDLRISGHAFCALLRGIAFNPVQLSLPLLGASP
jgi:ribose 1,5-bisphosphokinase PhnN